MDALSYYGNIASFIGLFLSLGGLIVSAITLRKVSSLRRHYTFIGRGDDFVGRLGRYAEELTNSLNNFAGSAVEVTGQLARLRATLEGLNAAMPAPQQKSVGRLLKRIHSYRVQSSAWQTLFGLADRCGEPGLRYIYNELLYSVEVTKDAQESIKWQMPQE